VDEKQPGAKRERTGFLPVEQTASFHIALVGERGTDYSRVPPALGSYSSYSHAGEEFIFMIAGELEIWLDEQGRPQRDARWLTPKTF